MTSEDDMNPAKTLENLDYLDQFGFRDPEFREIHHWGDRSDRDGSLQGHRTYLEEIRANTNQYRRSERHYIVAQRIEYIANGSKNRGKPIDRAFLCSLIEEAKQEFTFPQE